MTSLLWGAGQTLTKRELPGGRSEGLKCNRTQKRRGRAPPPARRSVDDFEAHRARRTGDRTDRRLEARGDEGEAAVGVRRDEHRDDQIAILGGPSVELLAELHDVQAVLSERRTDGWR